MTAPTITPASQLPAADTQSAGAGGGTDNHDGHRRLDAHSLPAVVAPTSPPARVVATPETDPLAGIQAGTGRAHCDTHGGNAGAVVVADPLLALLADTLDDLERTRIANENRLRQLTRDTTDADGIERGFGFTLDQPQVASLAGIVEALTRLEHAATLTLNRHIRKHPLGPWVKATVGVGEKQGARLLSAIGDPYWNTLHDRPRTVSELWAYCGLHVIPASQSATDAHAICAGGGLSGDTSGQVVRDARSTLAAGVAARRRKGVRSNWSANAKMRAYLVATSCIKQLRPSCKTDDEAKHVTGCTCSAYRIDYDLRRARTTTTHPDWTPGHSHADALRIASKAILRDLWIEARRIHQEAAA